MACVTEPGQDLYMDIEDPGGRGQSCLLAAQKQSRKFSRLLPSTRLERPGLPSDSDGTWEAPEGVRTTRV